MSLFDIFKFPTSSVPVRPDVAGNEPGRQMPASAGGHCQGRCRGDIAGAQDKVSETGIPEQRCKVFPSVSRGYRLCYTREYRQGG
ncbi:unnamed protein product, partial [Staurois parvus]